MSRTAVAIPPGTPLSVHALATPLTLSPTRFPHTSPCLALIHSRAHIILARPARPEGAWQ